MATSDSPNAMPSDQAVVRDGEARDLDAVLGLIHELARFEKLPGPDGDAPQRLQRHFAERRFSLFVAERAGRVVGYALYFFTYGTFSARPTLYLEDLYVMPTERGRGLGRAFLRRLAEVAVAEECGRFDWCVLDWNVRAQELYRSLGAEILDEWRVCRLSGAPLTELGRAKR